MFYGIIANVLDDLKKPDQALKIYGDALNILDNDPKFAREIADLHFNMGITYFRLEKTAEARKEVKTAIELDYPASFAALYLVRTFLRITI